MKRSIANARKHRRLYLFAARFAVAAALWQLAIGLLWPDLEVLRNGLVLIALATWIAVLVIVLVDLREKRP